jgi:hypothetical protein
MTESVASFPVASVTLTDASPGEITLYPARFIADREHGPTLYRFYHGAGETTTYEIKLGRLLDRRQAAIDTIELSVMSGDAAIEAGQLSGTNVRVSVTMGTQRFAVIKMLALQDNGDNRIIYIKLDGSQ